jgi:hypothetical protein
MRKGPPNELIHSQASSESLKSSVMQPFFDKMSSFVKQIMMKITI